MSDSLDPMNCSPPGFSVRGIIQARILEWIAILGSSQPRNQTLVSCITDRFFIVWATGKRWRIDAFELWSWRRLLRVPWTARKSNQSILKEISPEYSLEGLNWNSNTLAPDAKNWFIGKDPDAGKDWRQEAKGTTEDEMIGCHNQLDGHEFE